MEKIEELSNQLYVLKIDLDSLRSLVNSLASDISSISSLSSRLTLVESTLQSAGQDITALTGLMTGVQTALGNIQSDINSLSSRATSCESNISSLSSRMTTAESNISTNAGDISALDTRLGTAESGISTNASDISTLSAGVLANQGNITTLTNRLGVAESDIFTNAGSIISLSTRMGNAESNISTNISDISSLSSRLNTAEGNITTNATDIATTSSALSTLQGDVTTLENRTKYVSGKNFIVNPAFHVNTGGQSSYSTTGTEIVYVDNWRMGTTNAQITYNYEGNHTFGAGSYIKQILEYDRIKGFAGKTCLLSICTSGVIGSGMVMHIKTVSGSNSIVAENEINFSGKGSNRVTSLSMSISNMCRQCEVTIKNTGSSNATCNIKWLKLEMGTTYTTFLMPVDREESYACCEHA